MLHEQRQHDGNYLTVKHGALCLESKEPKDGYEMIEGDVNGEPYKKYIKKFAGLDGQITKVEWYDRTHDQNTFRGLKLTVRDRGEYYQLDLPFEKRPYDYFTKVAENIDYAKPVEIVAWPDKKGATRPGMIPTAFAIKQDGKFVQWKYVRDDMGDCPDAKQLRTGKWSFDDQREWLLDRIINIVIPQVDASAVFDEPMSEYTSDEVDEDAEAERAAIEGDSPLKTYVKAQGSSKVVDSGIDPNDPLNSGPDVEGI